MAKNNQDFFYEKKEWSKIKDDLLKHYLAPYFSKILCTGRSLLYVDGFAGKGVFDDGEEGSPVIACDELENAMHICRRPFAEPRAYFIEKQHGDELSNNLRSFSFAQAVSGDFETEICTIAREGSGKNLFLYADPYGVKHLHSGLFGRLSHGFDSVEILLNFNSFGFFRAACSVFRVRYDDVEDFDAIEERDPWNETDQATDADKLSAIVGGDFWKAIVLDYREKKIDGYEAEVRLTKEFCETLRQDFAYVLNMPIRLRESHRPKYRMIHLSNHHEGCLLMYDNMQRRLQELFDIQYQGQSTLFQLDSENEIVEMEDSLRAFERHLMGYPYFQQLERVLADFVVEAELGVPLTELREVVQRLEKTGAIEVLREPSTTKGGRKSCFLQSSNGKKIRVRANNEALY